jgi:5,10-methylenetetrahydromethanopterin reductase
MLRLGVVGGAGDIIEQCGELVALGARHLSFGPPLGPDASAAMALLAKDVLPALRRMHRMEATPVAAVGSSSNPQPA